MAKKFNFNIKVYYEDTDAGGVVYYANYLKFLERARSEAIHSLGFSNKGLLENHGILLIVKSCNIQYKQPAQLEDLLEISSEATSFTKTSILMKQLIIKNKDIISEAEVHLVAVDNKGKPTKIPDQLKRKLEN
jgi:acyl-CoA thioester hydrolase